MPEPIILIEKAGVRLGGVPVIQDVSLSIDAGEFISILGPNGAGKTTLLKLLLGLIRPDTGRVRVLDRAPRRGLAEVGYVPQRRVLDIELALRARDLVGFGLDGHRWGIGLPDRGRNVMIEQALEEVDALQLADAPVGQLSGGEQQRLLLAQALLSGPRLLLLDEPLANLDPAHQHEAVALIERVRRVHGVTVLLVSHDINPLLPVTDRVVYLAGGHCAIGSPQQVITGPTLSMLYGAPVEVVHIKGRYFVIGVEV